MYSFCIPKNTADVWSGQDGRKCLQKKDNFLFFSFLGPKMNGVFISFVAVLFTVLSISTEATPIAGGGELNNNGKKF